MKTIMQCITKRLATMLLFAAATLMPQVANAAGTQPSGSGTTSSPYQIATASNLLWFADAVNGGNNNICAKLTADITLSGETSDYMIGTKEYGFKGEFDGQGHTISGVNVTTTKIGKNSYLYAGGLFGCIDVTTETPAVVKNVTVEGTVNITELNTHYYVGGVIAIAWGYVNISNVVSKVNVTTTTKNNAKQYAHCGGVLASVEWFEESNYKNYLTMSNCVNYGTLNVACGDICGGVVGYVRNGSITDCLNVGNITNSTDCSSTSGVLGYTNDEDCTMSRCLNVGTVTNTAISSKAYAVYYAKNNNIGAVSNLYYKSGTAAGTSANTTAISDANLKSGSLGYTFASNGWGQSIGNNSVNDACPIPNKADYKVYQTGSNYCNNITSTIPTGDFTTTIETTAKYKSNLTRIGTTKSFTVTANAGYDVTEVQHNGTTLTASDVSGNVYTYSYTVALNNSFSISTYKHPKFVGDAYEIAYAEDLYWFASQVNNGNTTINGKLVADIVVNEHVLDADGKLNGNGAGFRIWNPIGSSAQKYNGVFDGQGHTISGLYFNDDSKSKIGLFGELKSTGKIMNVGVVDSYFCATTVAGICSFIYGTIENCFNMATCKGDAAVGGISAQNYGYIVNCYNIGDISGIPGKDAFPNIGGVCGNNYKGSISNSKNAGRLSASKDDTYIGGVCGKNEIGKISFCHNTGVLVAHAGITIYGGVCGHNQAGTIDNCYNTAAITTAGSDSQSIGGVCGISSGNISYCYNTGVLNTSGGSSGSVCGKISGCDITNCYYLDGTFDKGVGAVSSGSAETIKKLAADFASGEVAWLLNGGTAEGELAWYQNLTENADAYPVLDSSHGKVYCGYASCGNSQSYSNNPLPTSPGHNYDADGFCTNCGSGHPAVLESDGYYEIADAAQLHWFAEQVNGGNATIKGKLTADITLSGSTDDYMIGISDHPFNGEFDGNNHTISGVNVTTAKTGVNNLKYAAGLFGCINASDDAATAVVKNLTVEGSVNIAGLTTKYYAGGVIGIAYGNVNVSNITSRVDVTIGSDGQKGHCGGVVASGEWFGSTNGYLNVSNCANYGTLNVACANVCGGVIGYIRKGSITDCLNVGDITNSEDGYTSGVLGYVRTGDCTMSRCLNVGNVTNDNYSSKVNPVCFINGEITTSNLYYKSGVCGTATNATEVSDEELESGAVAWLLNGSTAEGEVAWYQNLSDNADAYPVLDSSHGKVYGGYVGCESLQLYYSNNPLPTSPEHNYDAYGFCSNCGSFQPATLISEGNYEIANAGQLYWFAEKVNNGNATINAKLTADIVVNTNVLNANGNINGEGEGFRTWTPIGLDEDGKKYEGTFDGQGHTVSGLYINDDSKRVVGLFCATSTNSVIKNVGIVDSYFYAYQHVAGICGSNGGLVENCFNAATCQASDNGAGGIVSWNGGTISNCYNKGLIAGGAGVCFNNYYGTVTNCYYLRGTATCGTALISDEAPSMTAEQFASGEVAWLLNGSEAGESPAWRQTIGEDEYPVLDNTHGIVHCGYNACTPFYSNDAVSPTQPEHHYGADGFCSNCGSVHPATLGEDGFYEIADAAHLYWFAEQVNNGNKTINGKLTADIVVNQNVLTANGELNGDGAGFRVWTPAYGYVGIFDGQGHIVSGLYFNDITKGDVGLFGSTGISGVIKNVGVVDSYFAVESLAAGICSSNSGTVENCYNAATCKVEVVGAGGIVSWNEGTITSCYSIGFASSSKMSGSVCAHNVGTVDNCYYLCTADLGVGKDGGKAETTKKTTAQFASGEVAWLLNGSAASENPAWKQTLGVDAYPVLDSSHGIVYQGYDVCLAIYSNSSDISTTQLDHPGYDEHGFCTKCGTCQPATLISEGNYEIANAGQLYWFAEQVNSGETTINAKLTADIVVNENVFDVNGNLNGDGAGFKEWTPIGSDVYGKTYGTFDGQGYTIKGLYKKDISKRDGGLYCYLGKNGVIKNVGVVDSYFYSVLFVGGMCGYNDTGSTISNCYYSGMVSAKDETTCIGGLCGYNFGTISNCYTTAKIMASVELLGCGGISGCNTGIGVISNCYYLEGTAVNGVGSVLSGSAETTAMSAEQFASGEVAWLLNGSEAGENPAWRQTIGEDEYPVLDAASGIVVKTTSSSLNSIVRPTAGTLVGATAVYNFAGIQGTAVYGIPQTGTLAASHPYVFMTNYDYVSFVPSDEEVTDNTPTCGLTGVLDPEGVKVYGNDDSEETPVSIVFTATALKYANPAGNTVKYGKCYINAGECFILSAPAMASKIAPAFEDGVDGLENVSVDSVEGETYNLQGIPVGDNYKGFIIQNGRKLLRR